METSDARKRRQELNPFDVRVGQVWEDCDWRSAGRKVTIEAIEGDFALVSSGPRKSRIRLNRFRSNSTGYRLVESQVRTHV